MDRRQFGDVLDELTRATSEDGHPAQTAKTRYQRAFIVQPERSEINVGTTARFDTPYVNEVSLEGPEAGSLESVHDWVVDKLQLTPATTTEDLHNLRRKFALAYHPDRVHPSDREWATQCMTIANVLIDQALLRRPD
jgi:hypothetical protein